MNILKKPLFIVTLIAMAGVLSLAFSTDSSKINHALPSVMDYNVYALPMPERLDFSQESVPLFMPDIKERMDRELLVNTYWQSNGLLLFKRAHKFFPIMEPILESYGIPNDFKYLALIESGLQQVTSPAGAKGFWQIMKSTGKEYGLEINSNVDERYNIKLSTQVACQYLLKAKEKFGTWTLAAASYNAGMSRISSELERQSVSDYYDLLLGEETRRYLFRIVALKEIMTHPKKYGFNFEDKDLYTYAPTFEIKIDTAVSDFVKFSKDFGINYKQLKLHNPWLREEFLNNKSRKKYTIELPEPKYYSRK
jgi:hypothetical protein